MVKNIVNTNSGVLDLTKPLPHEEVMDIINAQLKSKEKSSMLDNFFTRTSSSAVSVPAAKPTLDKIITYNHVKDKQTFVFSIPGVDPKNFKIINKDRKIAVVNVDKVVGIISTYDQIDSNEISATYKFGQLLVTIDPNNDKYKEYEVKIVL